jgi:hypothetical protein
MIPVWCNPYKFRKRTKTSIPFRLGLPDGISSIGMEKVGTFFGHLEYVYALRPFGTFYGNLVIQLQFGIVLVYCDKKKLATLVWCNPYKFRKRTKKLHSI